MAAWIETVLGERKTEKHSTEGGRVYYDSIDPQYNELGFYATGKLILAFHLIQDGHSAKECNDLSHRISHVIYDTMKKNGINDNHIKIEDVNYVSKASTGVSKHDGLVVRFQPKSGGDPESLNSGYNGHYKNEQNKITALILEALLNEGLIKPTQLPEGYQVKVVPEGRGASRSAAGS
jgi:hypothetical protein